MTESGSAHLSELSLSIFPRVRPAYVRTHFGVSSFGINAWTTEEPGTAVISEHDEIGPTATQHEELYFVAEGHARFVVDGDEIDAPEGTYVFVRDPAAKRCAEALEAGTTVISIGGKPGEAFTPSAWERSAAAFVHWNTDFEEAAELLGRAHREHPDDARVLYNLACAESRAGRRDEALGHLRETVELDPSFRDVAKDDSDLDAIRDDPEFASTVAGEPGTAGAGA